MSHFRIASVLVALLVTGARTFAQTCPFPAPTVVEPAAGARSVATPVTFSWTAVASAIDYEVWASFAGAGFERLEITKETRLFDDVPPAISVEWYVVANFTTCSTRSAAATFTTGACDPPPAELMTPGDGAQSGSPVTFAWSEVEDADGYRLWIDARVEAQTRHTEADAFLEPGVHRWYVEAFFDDCGSSASATRTLEVARASNCAQSRAALIAPAAGSTVASPVVKFLWNAVPDAIGYEVRAALGDGALEIVDETFGTSLTARLAAGRITWVVVARFDGCDDTVSTSSSFTIPYDPLCDNGTPLPIAPANDADNVPTRVDFLWTAVARAKIYNVYVYPEEGEGDAILVGSTTATRLSAEVPVGELGWVVEAEIENCASEVSPLFVLDTAERGVCRVPAAPAIFLEPRAASGAEVLLIWSAGLHASSYEVQESSREDFSGATTRVVTDIVLPVRHVVGEATRFFYRVRAQSRCGLGFGPWSASGAIAITASTSIPPGDVDLATSYGNQSVVVQKIRLPGATAPQPFTATLDKPWLNVLPASGTIPPEGIELTITADPRNLPVGSSMGTLTVAGQSVPISVNLVTPVSPDAGTTPLPGSLIIPAVAHVDGIGAKFESDVRLANASAQVMKYQLLFTPSRANGTRIGQEATIQVEAGQTAALDDILKNVFGYAQGIDSISGVLEIRPLTHLGRTLTSFASSRTFASGISGTYGQFIPAIPYSQFIGRGDGFLSLQQIAQSALYRTNFGLVEASGEPATVQVSVFGDTGQRVGDFDIALQAGEHMQLGALLAQRGLSVDDGRIEVAVTSSSGKVTAYASVLDNRTNDPMFILPVDPSKLAATRYILPGLADLDSGGTTGWRSDVRIFNAADASTDATLTYHPQGNPTDQLAIKTTLAPRETLSINGALQSLFNVANGSGSLVITTPERSRLVATARTYFQTGNGTYGQFIPAVTAEEGVGAHERALQLLQVEESDRFRTNIGIVELTGKPVTVEISVFTPDAKASAFTQVELQANEYRQFDRLLRSFGLPSTYNARVTLKVVSGGGRISGYASLVDNGTNDGTYIPAQ